VHELRRRGIGGGAIVLALLMSACTPTMRPKEPAVFFPSAPNLPRIQYLTHLTGRKDIEKQSTFNRFVVGEKQNLALDKPYGVAMHDGRIYACDTNATVTVFDLKAQTFSFLKGAVGQGVLRQPVNISITPDGTKYVSDPLRGQVVVFDAADDYVRAYGTPGTWKPVDAAAYAGRLYVADMEQGHIVVLDLASGEMVASIGDKGDPANRLSRPTNLVFDKDGFVYVTDISRFQVVKYDREGGLVATFGKLGDNLGHFARPKGVAVDRNGFVYVVDAAFSNVQIFTPSGRLATFFGGPGKERGNLMLPAKVSIDYDGIEYFRSWLEPGFVPEYLVLVTSQFGDRLVNVFAFGHEEGKHYPTEEELLKELEARRPKAPGTEPVR